MSFLAKLNKAGIEKVYENELMSGRTTLGVGGPADYFIEPSSEDELAKLMQLIGEEDLPWMVVGDGANLLVADSGIRGVIIHLADAFTKISLDGNLITAGAAAKVSNVADIAAQNSLTGLEGVGTVPGGVGGAIVMNAGTHRGYIDEVTQSVSVVTEKGERKILSHKECGFSYRNSRFQWDRSFIITGAEFLLRPGKGGEIRRHLDEVRQHRLKSQPQGKSAGCFFKNPHGKSAGALIQNAGGGGLRIGGAVVSEKHSNFIMNENNATAADLWFLAEHVKELVKNVHGVDLEYEVRLVGDW